MLAGRALLQRPATSAIRSPNAAAASQLPPRLALPTPATGPALAPAATPNADCPTLRPLRDELATRRRELTRPERPAGLFERSPPNPTGTRQLAALLNQTFAESGRGCEQTTSCQGVVCRVETMRPEGVTSIQSCWKTNDAYWEFEERYIVERQLAPGRGPVHDPLSRRGFRHEVDYLQLAALEPVPVPEGARFEAPPVSGGRHRALPLPPGLTAACRTEGERLKAEIEQAWSEQDRRLDAPDAFRTSVLDPAASSDLEAAIGETLGLGDARSEFAVECRGRVCTIRPQEASAPRWPLPFRCKQKESHEICNVDHDQESWYVRLERASWRPSFPADLFAPASPQRPAYAKLRPPADRLRPDPRVIACRFGREIMQTRVIERCEAEHGGAGTLELWLMLARPGRSPATPAPVEHGGSLANPALRACVVDALGTIIENHPLPEGATTFTIVKTLRFPHPEPFHTPDSVVQCLALERGRR